ncbi:MAG TPA: 2-oxoglutarate dehydrogenase E1 component [Candidatus Hydrogenedentes bacterium]|nr:2-oxoglutarate dehydrogenase E1 component [Candidatus Hydrogenedentota bacterium]HOL77373.1 2-oxoglutarate dehydrogenase E1 component [Candidatus Hydrogenedentota bacterium]HPO84809.1 2-oxoglutarate dehydrogenase E1 component [Candidatus Hydrogenedentota bacterium]
MDQPPEVLSGQNLTFLESLYQEFVDHPDRFGTDWQEFFESANGFSGSLSTPIVETPRACKGGNVHVSEASPRCAICGREEQMAALQHRVDQLIRNYRLLGHRAASLDPLGRPLPHLPELEPEFVGLSEEHMDRLFSAGSLSPHAMIPLREIVQRLKETYCRYIGFQFMHIDDIFVREWLQERIENPANRTRINREEQLRIFKRLSDAVLIEEFIQNKFTGMKRFSLEGAESLIPLLDLAIEKAGADGLNEIIIGMAHRGRINVLANIMGKSLHSIFKEFADTEPEKYLGGGDVKYHLGFHNDWVTTCGKEVHLALCFNPSHLEFVNPVAMGRTRAKQDRMEDLFRNKYLLLLIHGDAAFAGEGIVQEVLNMSELEGYRVGGAIHVIVNNQIGFTTTEKDARSTVYASDVAKMLQIPILHVNGENPEAVAQVMTLAMDFRRTFRKDVVIDMYCYRRRGHNEGDEPSFTQPVMYRIIGHRKSVRDGYLEHLLALNEITREEAEEITARRRAELEEELKAAQTDGPRPEKNRPSILGRVWQHYKGGPDSQVEEVDTGVSQERLKNLLQALTKLPEDFYPHPKIVRWLEQRAEMARGTRLIDWAAAEALAFATLAVEGTRVRLSGQDSRRGTFSHRHAVLFDYETGEPYMPLGNLAEDQAPVEIYNSPLCEAGVLGFEYGYSIGYPDALVIWEAQFGDFANCAQVIIDQNIVSAEDKWKSLSGLVMLLPHGFEGMGPEHSSARLERFLALCAEDNIQVVYPTTPAQFFHVLRRQVLRPWRKPLIIMSPKSLLRHPQVVSPLSDLAEGRFKRILPDTLNEAKHVKRIILCTGKIFYELAEQREKRERKDVAIVRVEQLYPLQESLLAEVMSVYPKNAEVVWVQEEPQNMGAWPYIHSRFCSGIAGRKAPRVISRAVSASPATGSANCHKLEQQEILDKAFSLS